MKAVVYDSDGSPSGPSWRGRSRQSARRSPRFAIGDRAVVEATRYVETEQKTGNVVLAVTD
jgi:hypothetical protein